jgi:hypothetical protein
MRITGWVLLVVGVLLCVSIAWATIGFLMMGLGLICLLAAEDRKKRVTRVTEFAAAFSEPRFQEARDPLHFPLPPLVAPIGVPSMAAIAALAIEQVRQGHSSYDVEKWNGLVAHDPDIAQLVEVLAPHGQQYVDELAAAYLALNDKNYLALIVDEIIASALRGPKVERATDATASANDARAVRRSKAPEPRSGRAGDLLRAAAVSREPAAADHAVAIPELKKVVTAAGSGSLPVAIAAAATEPDPASTPPAPVAALAQHPAPDTEPLSKAELDDSEDLRELFKAIGA